MKIHHKEITPNFIYPDIKPEHYRFGNVKFTAPVILEDGDWRPYLPLEEEQNKRGVESSACYIEAQQHAIATIEELLFKEENNNYSSRFNALLSNGTLYGGDPLAGAESIRKNDGLIPDDMMPFSENIESWDEFHSWEGADEYKCMQEGKKYLETKELKYDIVFERWEDINTKYSKLKEALKLSPVPISVNGWYRGEDGMYFKPEKSQDNHLTLAVYLDENNSIYVWDTYKPFLKKLTPYYNCDFAMRWSVKKKHKEIVTKEDNLWNIIKRFIIKLLKLVNPKYV